MEFLQILMAFIAILLLIKKPEKENLAFSLVVVAWIFMLYLYIGHRSDALLSNICF